MASRAGQLRNDGLQAACRVLGVAPAYTPPCRRPSPAGNRRPRTGREALLVLALPVVWRTACGLRARRRRSRAPRPSTSVPRLPMRREFTAAASTCCHARAALAGGVLRFQTGSGSRVQGSGNLNFVASFVSALSPSSNTTGKPREGAKRWARECREGGTAKCAKSRKLEICRRDSTKARRHG